MKNRRMLAMLVCLVLVVSMAVVASAAISTTFFNKKSGGYQCLGYGSIDGYVCSASFNAKALPMQQIIPDVDCVSEIHLLAFDSFGDNIGAEVTTGTVNADAVYSGGTVIEDIYCTFEFNGEDLGGYLLMG